MCEVDVINLLLPSTPCLLPKKVQELVTTERALVNVSGIQVVIVQFLTVFIPARYMWVPTASWDGELGSLVEHDAEGVITYIHIGGWVR